MKNEIHDTNKIVLLPAPLIYIFISSLLKIDAEIWVTTCAISAKTCVASSKLILKIDKQEYLLSIQTW